VGYLSEWDKAMAAPDGTVDALAAYAAGPALDEAKGAMSDLVLNGNRIVGKAKITQLSVFAGSTPDQVRVVACVDSAGISVVATNGFVVKPTSKTPILALNEYFVTKTPAGWRVTGHTMSSDTSCGKN